ncbi:hypothetical protein FH972_000304 [Carpinus fangiana]|uniref:Uncharacterized protein n=1 Tax=Carpinus fangiana TaxID=176857 RepID=A0A5N6QBD2_9ROSI|nr:hypothetical protein FH972_000304 [Carpinus fangiana]
MGVLEEKKVRQKMAKQWSLEISPIVHLEASLCKHLRVFVFLYVVEAIWFCLIGRRKAEHVVDLLASLFPWSALFLL